MLLFVGYNIVGEKKKNLIPALAFSCSLTTFARAVRKTLCKTNAASGNRAAEDWHVVWTCTIEYVGELSPRIAFTGVPPGTLLTVANATSVAGNVTTTEFTATVHVTRHCDGIAITATATFPEVVSKTRRPYESRFLNPPLVVYCE